MHALRPLAAALCLLGLVSLANAVCTSVAQSARRTCTNAGGTQASCEALNCCYDSAVGTGVPFCYYNEVETETACSTAFCTIPYTYNGNTYTKCTLDSSTSNLLWCGIVDNVPLNSVQNTDWCYCKDQAIATTPSGPCVDGFKVYQNQRRLGGNKVKDVSTSELCISSCRGDAQCEGLDFNRLTSNCYHFYSDLTNLELSSSTDIDSYERQRCPADVTTPGAPTTPPRCVDTFTQTEKTQAFGGKPYSAPQSLLLCQNECLALPNCVGLDYNRISSIKCYLFENIEVFNDIKSGVQNVDHYRRDSCDVVTPEPPSCEDTYSLEGRLQAYNGKAMAGTNTVEDCQVECSKIADCAEFDFDDLRPGASCYYFTDDQLPLTKVANTAIAHYVRDTRCSETTTPVIITSTASPGTTTEKPCVYVYPAIVGKGARGGEPRVNIVDISGCEEECTAEDACVAFDWSTKPGTKCWVHLSVDNLDRQYDDTAINLHIQEACPDEGTTTDSDECQDFIVLENYLSYGGSAQPDQEVDVCMAKCLATEGCVGFDFVTAGSFVKCYIHDDVTKFEKRIPNENVNQYIRQDCDPSTTLSGIVTGTTSSVCEDFKLFDGKFSHQGAQVDDIDALEACIEHCRVTPDCKSVDYNVADKSCWTHDEEKVTYDNAAVKHYVKQDDCIVSTTPSVCGIAYAKRDGRNSLDGKPVPSAMTEADCKGVCTSLAECVSIDYVPNGSGTRCYWHDKEKVIMENAAVDQYFKVDTCDGQTTSSPATGTPGECEPDFTYIENSRSIGGQGRDIDEIADCKQFCNDDETCVGFDYDDTADKPCFFFFDSDTMTSSNSEYNGIDQYRITKRCDTATSTTATPTPTPTASSTASPCNALWARFEDTNAPNGVYYADPDTVEECQEQCLDVDECVAIDYSPDSGRICWLHNNAANLNDLGELDGVTHMELKDRCFSGGSTATGTTGTTTDSCVDTFTKIENVHANGADLVEDVTTEADCKDHCLGHDDCVAIDVDSQCWMHTDEDKADNTKSQMGTNHYTRVRDDCGAKTTSEPGCETVMIKQSDTSASGGTPKTEFDSLDECNDYCLETEGCTGFDYDGTCWLFDDDKVFDIKQTDGVDHYVKIDQCEQTTTSQVATTPGGCAPQWVDMPNKRGHDGQKSPVDTDNEDICKQYCVDEPSCVAIDLEPAGSDHKCWLFLDRDSDQIQSSNTISHFVLVQRCTVTLPPTQGPCENIYTLRINTHYIGGVSVGIMSVQQCKSRCNRDDRCVAVDYNNELTECFVHLDINNIAPGRERGLVSIDHYRIDGPKCSTGFPTEPTSATPEASTIATAVPETWSAVWVGRDYDATTSESPLQFNVPTVDLASEYLNEAFSPRRQGVYYIGMSAGIRSGRTVDVKLVNAYPPVGLMRQYTRTYANTDVDMISRDTTAALNPNDRVFLSSQNEGVASSSPQYQTAFFAYRLNDMADLNTLFHVASSARQTNFGVVDFNEIIQSPFTAFDISNDRYLCRQDGTYVFHISAGAVANQPVRLYMMGTSRQYALRRESTSHFGLDIISRTIVTRCLQNQEIRLELASGEIYSDGTDYQLSWIGYRYAPQGTSTVFAAYRTFSWTGSMFQPISFDVMERNDDFDGTRFYCRMGGVFQIYFGTGYDRNERIHISLVRTRQGADSVIAALTADGSNVNGIDTVGRSVLVQTIPGDFLHLRTDIPATLYADPLGFQISFIGLRLYGNVVL